MENLASEEELPFIPLKDRSRADLRIETKPSPSPHRTRIAFALLAASAVLNVVLLLSRTALVVNEWPKTSNCQVLYCKYSFLPSRSTVITVFAAPATDAIEYKLVKFTRGYVGDVPLYERPPSPSVDAAWKALWLRESDTLCLRAQINSDY